MTKKVQFELVTPVKLLVSQEADMVVVPGGEGDFGVLPGHAPLLATVRPGTVDIYENDVVSGRVFVSGGFAEVSGRRCTVLAEEAMALGEITAEAARERIAGAQKRIDAAETDSERKDARRDLKAAEAMLAAVDAARV